MDKGIENLMARLHRNLVRDLRIAPAANSSTAAVDAAISGALGAMYEAGRAEVLRDQAPCDAVVRAPGVDRPARCMKLAGHAAPHESADGWQWWSPADGSALAAVGRSDDAEPASGPEPEVGQADVEG